MYCTICIGATVVRLCCSHFARHAQPNYNNHDDLTRELSEKGSRDRLLVDKQAFGYADFCRIRFLMLWIVAFTFDENVCVNIQQCDLFAH